MDLEPMAMKGYSEFRKTPPLLEPHHFIKKIQNIFLMNFSYSFIFKKL